MNRREMFKKIVGVVAVGAVGPKVLEASEKFDYKAWRVDVPGMPAVPAYTPPPPDLRTPEQIWEDQVADETRRYLNPLWVPEKRYVSFTQPPVFNRVKATLAEQNKLDLVVIDGKECIDLPGCVLTVW